MTKIEILKSQKEILEKKIRQEEIAKVAKKSKIKIKNEIDKRMKEVMQSLDFDQICNEEEYEILTSREKSQIIESAKVEKESSFNVDFFIPTYKQKVFWF